MLDEFAQTFDFSNMGIDAALRVFLECFRLPGESQKIHRIVEAFADRYYQQSKGILASKDAAFVLSYSVIMLNTDQHNKQVRPFWCNYLFLFPPSGRLACCSCSCFFSIPANEFPVNQVWQ